MSLANTSDAGDGWWQSQSQAFAQSSRPRDRLARRGRRLDRPIDATDQAKAMLATLDELGLPRAAAFVGASYGAMVGMHCAAIAPTPFRALLAISGADRSHPFTSAQRALQRQASSSASGLARRRRGVALARKLAILTYRTPQEFAAAFRRASA